MNDRFRPAYPAADRLPTLGQVIRSLGEHGLQVVVEPPLPDVDAGEPVIVGPGEPVPPTPAGILLLAGSLSPDQQSDALGQAADAGFGAVIVKTGTGTGLPAVADAARVAGLALLCTPSDMSWRHLDTLLTASRSAAPDAAEALMPVGLGDFFALANAIASTVGGAVSIEDVDGQVLGYSSLPHQKIDPPRRDAILGRWAAEYPRAKTLYNRVMTSDDPVLIAPHRPEIAARMGVAVRAGSRVIGTIWVIADRPPLVSRASELLASAAQIAALHLLRARRHSDPEGAARSEALRLLLDGSTDAHASALRLGIPFDTATIPMATVPVSEPVDPMLAAARVVDLVSLHVQAWHSSTPCAVDSGVVYALVPADGDDVSQLKRLAGDLASAVRRSAGIDVMVAIGPRAATLADAPGSRRMADRVLRAMAEVRARTGGQVVVADVASMRSTVLLQALAEHTELIDELRLDWVAAVVAHDAEHETSYARTLTAFYGALGDTARTAREVIVHENTVRYRMRRAQDLFGLDLEDPDEILTSWLQLRLLELRRS